MIELKHADIPALLIASRRLTDEHGLKVFVRATKIVMPERMRAEQEASSRMRAGTGNSDVNPVRSMAMLGAEIEYVDAERIEVHTDSGHVLTIGSAFPTVIYADRRLHEEDVAGTITYLGGQWEGVDLPTTYAGGADAAHWKRIAEDRLVAANQSLERARKAEELTSIAHKAAHAAQQAYMDLAAKVIESAAAAPKVGST